MTSATRLASAFAALVGAALLAAPASAQVCPDPAHQHYQNDVLPQVPGPAVPIAIVPGLCEGEAAAAVFTTQGSGTEKLTQVACPFNSPTGAGLSATVNLVVYDDVTFDANGVPDMSDVAFDLNADTGNSLQVQPGGLNTFDVSQFNIRVDGPRFAVAFFMNINPNGNCASGYQANFFTDNTACSAETSLIFIQGQGWRDASKATVQGFPLCPFFYNGDWVIRACTQVNSNPFEITVIGSPALPGQFVNLIFNAPGRAGELYVAGASFTTSPGIPIPPHGVFPLNYDILFEISVLSGGGGIFNNFVGTIGPAGSAPGLILLPPSTPPGLTFNVAFVAFDPLNPTDPWAVSDPAQVQVQ